MMAADLRAVVVEAVRQLDAEIEALGRVDGQAWRRCEVAVEGLSDLRRSLAHALWAEGEEHIHTFSPVDDAPDGGVVLECIYEYCDATVVEPPVAKLGVHGAECLAHDDPDECVCRGSL